MREIIQKDFILLKSIGYYLNDAISTKHNFMVRKFKHKFVNYGESNDFM